jgi:hypothetical protein
MTTDAPSRKPDQYRAMIKKNWHRLTRRDKCAVSAVMAAYLDKKDDCLSPLQRAEFDRVRPHHGQVDLDQLDAWLLKSGYLTPSGQLGERTLLRLPSQN